MGVGTEERGVVRRMECFREGKREGWGGELNNIISFYFLGDLLSMRWLAIVGVHKRRT